MIYAPAFPVFFGHIYFAYDKHRFYNLSGSLIIKPTYVCYNDQLLYLFNDNKTFTLSDNRTCRLYTDSQVKGRAKSLGRFQKNCSFSLIVNENSLKIGAIITYHTANITLNFQTYSLYYKADI